MKKILYLVTVLFFTNIIGAQDSIPFKTNITSTETNLSVLEKDTGFEYGTGYEATVRGGFKSAKHIFPLRLKLEHIHQTQIAPLILTSHFGYLDSLSLSTGVGGIFGKRNINFCPKVIVLLGYKDGVGVGYSFHASTKSEIFSVNIEEEFVVDYRLQKDAVWSEIELVVKPKKWFEFGFVYENILKLERKNDEMYYSGGESESELSAMFCFITHYGIIRLAGGTIPSKEWSPFLGVSFGGFWNHK